MGIERPLRKLYASLLRLYPAAFRSRFGECMEQTFCDMCRERQAGGRSLFGFAVGIFVETFAGILRERIALIMLRQQNIIRLALITACMLAVPLVAMQFTDQVVWTATDFVIGGGLIFGAGLVFLLIAGKGGSTAVRSAAGLAVATAFLLIWVNLAIGIIGSENNPANALYLAVLLVLAVGAAIVRAQAAGMVRVLFAAALTQFLVPFVALLIWRPQVEGVIGIFFMNSIFALLFVGSAALFRRAETSDLTSLGGGTSS